MLLGTICGICTTVISLFLRARVCVAVCKCLYTCACMCVCVGGGVKVVAFSSLARIWGQCSTIHSPPALFFFFLKWRLARAD